MTMPRRTIIKGMAAAPLAAVAGAVFAPAVAEAGTLTPGQFTLAERVGNSHGRYVDLVAGLARAPPTATVADVLAGANRDARHLAAPPSGVGAFQDGFAWNPGDQGVEEWVPQGVTTSADALGSGGWSGKRVVLVSWYVDTDPNGDGTPDFPVTKGVRVSFVDCRGAAARGRHLRFTRTTSAVSSAAGTTPVLSASGARWRNSVSTGPLANRAAARGRTSAVAQTTRNRHTKRTISRRTSLPLRLKAALDLPV
ncbi:hypothetical protein ACFVHB_13290 [Kitasatospora sp. NPDC127111]|uniref:hypothetical protein n=1 Tax=Kitasatospora sp. NPDC127111 TaxID=3345363 RepID=UPI00362D282E